MIDSFSVRDKSFDNPTIDSSLNRMDVMDVFPSSPWSLVNIELCDRIYFETVLMVEIFIENKKRRWKHDVDEKGPYFH